MRTRSLFLSGWLVRFVLLALVAGGWPRAAGAGGAGVPPPVPVPYLDEAPTIDGRPDDWPAVPPTSQFWVPQRPPADPNRVRVRLGWDEQFLYALYEVRDQRLTRVAADGAHLHLNDAVELFVDPRADSRTRMDVNDYQFIVDLTGTLLTFKGDRHLLIRGDSVPKEAGTATLLVRVAATHAGTLNHGADRDSGYVVELAVPWAGLGRDARAGLTLRLDVCCEDMDSVLNVAAQPNDQPLAGYAMRNWVGQTDFGFPADWRAARLVGGPTAVARLSRTYARGWLYGAAVLALGLGLALVGVVRLTRQVRRLRQVPVRAALPPASRQLALPPGAPPESAVPFAEPATELVADLVPVSGEEAADAAAGPAGSAAVPPSAAPPHQALFERCRAYILRRLDDDLSPDELAAEVAVSVRNLQRFCREELDLTPAGYITAVKLEQAAARLRAGATVQEAATATGFADASYFGRVFKKYFGLTPRQWAAGKEGG